MDGPKLGLEEGNSDGPKLGKEDGPTLGEVDGDELTLGAALGAGLLLGTVLGMSVGHRARPLGDVVRDLSSHKATWVIAVGPCSMNLSCLMLETFSSTFLYCPTEPGSTLMVLVAPSESVASTHVSST